MDGQTETRRQEGDKCREGEIDTDQQRSAERCLRQLVKHDTAVS